MDSLADQIHALGRRAKAASRALARASADKKNVALRAMADALVAAAPAILAANADDLARGERVGLSAALLDRLRLDEKRLVAVADAVRAVADLPDPVGENLRRWTRPNGIEISKVRVPIGVVGIIYESRPNVTADAAALCVKAGNAALLRGGSEALATNLALAAALGAGLERTGLPADAVLLIPRPEREAVALLAAMDGFVDVIVPRGGRGLIEAVVASARMPVIKHYDGRCTLYVDRFADPGMAADIAENAKCQRPGVCNAIETMLVHHEIAPTFLPAVAARLWARGVEIRGDERCAEWLRGDGRMVPAKPEDWDTEFLDLILAVRVVNGLDEAIAHIETHGSHHSDAIVTTDPARAERFLNEVDSATVYWNASTRFTDGGEFGFGAEIGISTDKLHARGPMALEELTTYKYVIRGDGQVRQ